MALLQKRHKALTSATAFEKPCAEKSWPARRLWDVATARPKKTWRKYPSKLSSSFERFFLHSKQNEVKEASTINPFFLTRIWSKDSLVLVVSATIVLTNRTLQPWIDVVKLIDPRNPKLFAKSAEAKERTKFLCCEFHKYASETVSLTFLKMPFWFVGQIGQYSRGVSDRMYQTKSPSSSFCIGEAFTICRENFVKVTWLN